MDVNDVAPPATVNLDLLAQFRTTMGQLANLPGFTVERIHLRLNIQMTESSVAANNGTFIAIWVDSINQVQLAASARPYDQQWLVFDQAYIGEAKMNGGTTPFYVNRLFDVRARRRIMNISDTLWLQLAAIGTATLAQYSLTMSTLLRLH